MPREHVRRSGKAPGRLGASGRGRSADWPSEIPARGWKEILIRVYRSISEDRVLANAAGVAFYALLALFPAIAALVSIYGLVADPADVNEHVDSLAGVLPSGGLDVIREQTNRLATETPRTLGLGVIVGLLVSIWSANSGVKAIMDALNVVYGEKEKRGFFKLNLVSLTFTVGAVLFLLVAMGVIVAIPIVLRYLPLEGLTQTLVSWLRWPAMLVSIIIALAILYRYGSSRDEPRWRWVSWGSVFAGVVWLGASILFSWYAANFGSFNKTYGSLGAVIGFMTWIWISTIVILIGGELNAELEHQTARDTTRPPPEPMGERGAHVADTVAPARA